MSLMIELISSLYPDDLEAALREIEQVKDKYRPFFEKLDYGPLSHRDAILITYGDAIYGTDKNPLETLSKFGQKYLMDKINSIHLLPCFPYTSDDGFSVVDYYEIDPKLGTWNDIEILNDDFHLMFDAVVNHMSQASGWFQGFLKGVEEYEDYFIEVDPNLDYSSVVRPRALPLFHQFKKKGEDIFVWTTFSRDQVDLNFKSYKVFIQILDVLLFYASRGARYIRLDAIAFLWKKVGSDCIHLEETHKAIQAYRSILESIGCETVLITETNVPHAENISYFGNGNNEAHMVYNFTLPPLLAYSLMQQDVAILTQWSKSLKLPGDEVCFFNFTASHDGVGVRPLQGIISVEEIQQLADQAIAHGGFVSYKDNGDGTQSPYELNCNYLDLLTHPNESDDVRINKFLLTQSVMLCMPGVPGIYYHSILGSRNNRKGAIESGINRRINREKLDIIKLIEELKDKSCFRSKVFQAYSNMLKARNNTPVFNPYGKAKYASYGPLYIIHRGQGNDQMICLHNFSQDIQSLDFLQDEYRDILTGKTVTSGQSIDGYGIKWLKLMVGR